MQIYRAIGKLKIHPFHHLKKLASEKCPVRLRLRLEFIAVCCVTLAVGGCGGGLLRDAVVLIRLTELAREHQPAGLH